MYSITDKKHNNEKDILTLEYKHSDVPDCIHALSWHVQKLLQFYDLQINFIDKVDGMD